MVEIHLIRDNGTFPNHATLPVLVYRGAIEPSGPDPAAVFERRFALHRWDARWRNGIFPFHHYHSTAHEVLGIARGSARVQLGGEGGLRVALEAGDVVVIPAGVAHKNLGSSGDFLVVGGYPRGQQWDLNDGRSEERPHADDNIAAVPLPDLDPVEGADGPLTHAWKLESLPRGS